LGSEGQLEKMEDAGNIRIQWEEDNHGVLILILLLILVVVLMLALSIYFQFSTADQLVNHVKFAKEVGILRKTLAYMNLFVYRMVSGHPAPTYGIKIGI